MKIISISIDEETEKEIEETMKAAGYSGRSETVRSGIRLLSEEVRSLGRLKDGSFCILVAAHNSRNEGAVSSIKHRYEDVISTQIHNNLKGNKCLEIFLLSGSAERIRKMVVEFNANKKISGSKLIIA